MKRAILLIALVVCSAAAQHALQQTRNLLTTGESIRIVCFGDSITGVYYHTGGRRAWSDMLGIALQRLYPKAQLQVINAGVSGNTTDAGLARMERDVLFHKPHLVVAMFGMNDMAFDAKQMSDAQVAEKQSHFGNNLREIVRRCRAAGSEVILCTPNSIYPDAVPRRPVERLAKYANEVRSVAAETQVPCVDCYAAYEKLRASEPTSWMLLMSETIHPNLNGHKLFAEAIAHILGGKRLSLSDVVPNHPYIQRTMNLLRQNKPIRVIAMEPYDSLVPRALQRLNPRCEVKSVCWPTSGKTLAELETWGKAVRGQKPDLVVVAVPPTVSAPAEIEPFIRSYSWIVNWALPFGRNEWDVVAILPSARAAAVPADQAERFLNIARSIILGHDVPCIERARDDRTTPEDLLLRWFEAQRNK